MMKGSLVTSTFHWPQAARSFSKRRATPNDMCPKRIYSSPELLFLRCAIDLILTRVDCESMHAAKTIRRLIDEFRVSLSFSPARECQKRHVDLYLVSRHFRHVYR